MKRKKLRKIKLLNYKKALSFVIVFVFISIGFAILTSSLNVTGIVTVKKKTWDATEVSYTTSKNTSVSTAKEAIDDLFDKFNEG